MIVDLGSTLVRDYIVTSPVITRRTTVATAMKLLREHSVPALPVWEDGRLAGLVDERALLRFTPSEATTLDIYELRDVLDKMTVARLVTPAVAALTPNTPLADAAALMLRHVAEVLPVLDAGRLVGLLTWTSLLQATVNSTAAPSLIAS